MRTFPIVKLLLGAFSGIVEPIAALVGILLATTLPVVMPWFLAFAAGAMIYGCRRIDTRSLDSFTYRTIAIMMVFGL